MNFLNSPTSLLKFALIVLALIATTFCVFFIPNLWFGGKQEIPEYLYILYPSLIALACTVLPFLYALYQAYVLLRAIDTKQAFSSTSVLALQKIKYSGVSMTVLYILALPLPYLVARLDDAPGLIVLSSAFACAPLVVATFAAVLQTLVQQAISLQSENQLTI